MWVPQNHRSMGKQTILRSKPTWWPTSFWVQPAHAIIDENIRILHRNMLFSKQTVMDRDLITTTTESASEKWEHVALMKANVLMNIHFDN